MLLMLLSERRRYVSSFKPSHDLANEQPGMVAPLTGPAIPSLGALKWIAQMRLNEVMRHE
jgi:hypothetical protein